MTVSRMIRPSLRASRVVYFSDMTRAGSRIIPLGVFCEIVHSGGHGLALKARSVLTNGERAAVASIFGERLSDPFKFLCGEFDAAWSQAEPGKCLDFLAAQHTAALSVLAPYSPAIERSWHRGLLGEPDAEAKLKNATMREFDALLTEVPPGDAPAPSDAPPIVRLQVAA
jgi:hypothetical protein